MSKEPRCELSEENKPLFTKCMSQYERIYTVGGDYRIVSETGIHESILPLVRAKHSLWRLAENRQGNQSIQQRKNRGTTHIIHIADKESKCDG